jgi:hypothetical protein
MKPKLKTIIITALVSTTFVACGHGTWTTTEYDGQENGVKTDTMCVKKIEKSYNGLVKYDDIMGICHFDYNGHSYITFHFKGSYGGTTGVTHDPDCKCNRNQK